MVRMKIWNNLELNPMDYTTETIILDKNLQSNEQYNLIGSSVRFFSIHPNYLTKLSFQFLGSRQTLDCS